MAGPQPLRPIELQILLSLAEEPRHGYGIVTAVREESGGRIDLEPGNLYRRLHALQADGLVREVAGPASDDERRRYYTLTAQGRRVAGAELERLQEVVRLGRARGVLSGEAAR